MNNRDDDILKVIAQNLVLEIQDQVCDLEIGKVVKHPSGRMVKIKSGQYLGARGVSNFWYWNEVLEDGSLGPDEHGYGWNSSRVA